MMNAVVGRELLENLYIKRKMSRPEISNILGISGWKVNNYIKKYNLTRYYINNNKQYKAPPDFYKKYNIDKTKLSRDWIAEPRKYNEIPPKDDIIYLHIELDLNIKILMGYFDIRHHSRFAEILSFYKISKNKIKKTEVLKHINKNFYKDHDIDINRLSKDFIKFPLKKKEAPTKDDLEYLFIEKNLIQTTLSKNLFGVSTNTFRTWCRKYQIKKSRELMSKNTKKRLKEIYGVECVLSLKDIQNKIHNSKKKNNTFNSSNPEKIIFEKILTKFPNTKRQYKSDLYPFNCDFYIPEIDTYVEYQGNWTHGKEPFISTLKQLKILEQWKSKNTPYYNKAILDWTERDVLKRETAKKNKLNWIEFFNMKQFDEWFERS